MAVDVRINTNVHTNQDVLSQVKQSKHHRWMNASAPRTQYRIYFFPSNVGLPTSLTYFASKCLITHFRAIIWIHLLSYESQWSFKLTQFIWNWNKIRVMSQCGSAGTLDTTWEKCICNDLKNSHKQLLFFFLNNKKWKFYFFYCLAYCDHIKI